jgi:hypothetical protein
MQLKCPNCGEPISSQHINIQQMAAVCPACHTVFQFDPSDSGSKIKRRKVKRPQQVTAYESDNHLHIAFRTNFRLDKNEALLSVAGFSVIFTFITLTLLSQPSVIAKAPFIPLGFSLITLVLYYLLALVAFNKTHIYINDEQIEVSRKPLPNPLTQPTTITLAGIETTRYEETPVSKKEHYDTPRYNVWAEMVDGNHKLIVGDVIEDYAVFVSQRLNEFLDLDDTPDVAHLLDDVEDGQLTDESFAPSASSNSHSIQK